MNVRLRHSSPSTLLVAASAVPAYQRSERGSGRIVAGVCDGRNSDRPRVGFLDVHSLEIGSGYESLSGERGAPGRDAIPAPVVLRGFDHPFHPARVGAALVGGGAPEAGGESALPDAGPAGTATYRQDSAAASLCRLARPAFPHPCRDNVTRVFQNPSR